MQKIDFSHLSLVDDAGNLLVERSSRVKQEQRTIQPNFEWCPFRKGYYDQYGNEQAGT